MNQEIQRTDTVEMEAWYLKAEQRGWMRQYEVERLCAQKGVNAREAVRVLPHMDDSSRSYKYDFNQVIKWVEANI